LLRGISSLEIVCWRSKEEREEGGEMAGGLVSVTERSEHGGPCLDTANEESVAHIQPSVGIVLGESSVQQPGTLYVTTR
jgi:hypothetical protein